MSTFLEKIIAVDANDNNYEILIRDAATALQCATNTTAIAANAANIAENAAAIAENTDDITELSKNYVYKSALSYGLDNTGVTDCSSILATATTNIGFTAGTYLIDNDCTINAQVVISDGAVLNITAGHTLTINGQILAGRYQIFEGSGSITVNEGIQDFGYPEWFNDDIHKCYNTFRHIKLGYKTYTINGNLILNRPNTCIEGVSYPTRWTENCSILNFNGGRLIIGTYNTTVINEFPRNITVKNMFISSNYNGEIMAVYGCVRPILNGLYLYTESGISGITFYRAIGAIVNNIYVQSVGITNTFYGYRFYDESETGAIGARSASVWLQNCIYADTNPQNGNTYGFYIGSHHSDVFMQNCEVAGSKYGLVFDSLSDDYSLDFLILNCDFDSCRENSILLFNCSKGSISIDNTYCANSSDSTTPVINIQNSLASLVMSNMQVITTNVSQTGILNTAAIKALMNSIIISGSGTAYSSSDNTYIKAQYLNNGVPTTI